MEFASNKFTWIPLYVVILGIFLYKFKWKGLLLSVALILSVVTSDQFASGLVKPWAKRWRPCHDPQLQGQVYMPNNHCGGDYGFISSHAANHFAVAAFLFFLFRKKYPWTGWFFLWAGWIAYSRVYLGVHFPGDVLLGGMVGVFFGWLFQWWVGRYVEERAG